MIISFYDLKDDSNVINKNKTLLSTLTIKMKRNDSVINPIIIITRKNFPIECNYCFIDGTNRFYFVDSSNELNNDLIELHLYVDVLETYKDEILNSNATITMKSEPSYFSGSLNVDSRTEIDTFYSDVELENTNTILLSTIGGGS